MIWRTLENTYHHFGCLVVRIVIFKEWQCFLHVCVCVCVTKSMYTLLPFVVDLYQFHSHVRGFCNPSFCNAFHGVQHRHCTTRCMWHLNSAGGELQQYQQRNKKKNLIQFVYILKEVFFLLLISPNLYLVLLNLYAIVCVFENISNSFFFSCCFTLLPGCCYYTCNQYPPQSLFMKSFT